VAARSLFQVTDNGDECGQRYAQLLQSVQWGCVLLLIRFKRLLLRGEHDRLCGVRRCEEGLRQWSCPAFRLFVGRVPDDATMGSSGSTESKYRSRKVQSGPVCDNMCDRMITVESSQRARGLQGMRLHLGPHGNADAHEAMPVDAASSVMRTEDSRICCVHQ
jgi:hypothetical protein